MATKRKHKKRKGNWLFKKFFVATGIPEAYSETVAWFAERMVLAAICLIIASFASGVLFTLYLSGPIAESQTYTTLADKTSQAKQQIIDIASPIFLKLIGDNREELQKEQIAARKEKLKQYFASKNSPFADDDKALTAFASSKNMKLMIAIAFVESTLGQHCYYFNCSGIGDSNLRRYKNYAEWIADFDTLLEQRYKNVPPEKFIGIYVKPGSRNWLHGVKQVLGELKQAGIEG